MSAPDNFEGNHGGASHVPERGPVNIAMRIGIWFALSLFLASMAPSGMTAALLRDLLLLAAMATGVIAMLRRAGPWQDHFNDFDVAVSLLLLALLSGLFVDHEALQAALQSAGVAGTAPQ